jgi:hypothetical protein
MDFWNRIKDRSKQETVDSSLTNVDPMGNYVGEYGTLTTEEDRKVKIETEQRRQAEEAKNESDAETQRLLRQNAAAQSGEDKKLAEEAQKEEEKKEPEKKQLSVGEPRDNPLFRYADYTYGLSFHVIPPEIYNQLAKDPNYVYNPKDKKGNGTVLIASAGRRNEVDFKRHPKFKEDFYFESLKFTTIVGLNARTRNTNSIDINFNLIEPYGMTLLNRLLKVADELETNSWMQIPFMMQIDFFGNTSTGDLMHPIPDQTKYIPVKLIGCKIKVTQQGATYQIQAIPFNHQAFQESAATTPAFFEVQAKTVNDFFSSGGSAGDVDKYSQVQKANKDRREAMMEEIQQEEDSNPKGQRKADLVRKVQEMDQEVSKISYQVGSYAAAMNSYQEQLKSAKYQNPDVYEFKFDPVIGNTDIVIPKKTDVRRSPMNNPNTKDGIAAIRAQAGLPTAGLNLSVETFSINAGTSVIDVINLVMRNSRYIRDQITDPAVDGKLSGQDLADQLKKPFNWYKIVPNIELLQFDQDRQTYAKKITYHVTPFTYYNNKFKDVPQSMPDAYAKEYDYMYTGKNQSILSFDIDFDTMFYTQITANRSNLQASAIQTQDQENKTDQSKTASKSTSIQDNIVRYSAGSQNIQNPQSPDSKGTLINDFSKSMLSGSRGDMINVKLKIIGDPEFIKQDDLFFNPDNNPNQRIVQHVDPKTNSIVYDAGEVFCKLMFRTPTDYDPASGLMKFEQVETSVFSGIYKILTVENEFSRGVFTQNQNIIRLFNQPDFDTLSGNAYKKKGEENRLPAAPTIAENQNDNNEIAEWDRAPEPVQIPVAESTPDESDQFNEPLPPSQTVGYSEFGDDAGHQTRAEQAELRFSLAQAETVNFDENEA